MQGHRAAALRLLLMGCAGAIVQPVCAQTASAQQGTAAQTAGQPYVDKVMDSSSLAATSDAASTEPMPTGWPRGLHFDTQLRTSKTGTSASNAQYLNFGGYLQTPNYGSWSTNGTLFRSTDTNTQASTSAVQSGATLRLDQRAMPLANGWLMNNSVGDINSPALPLSGGLGRLQLPSAPLQGVASQIEWPGSGMLQASVGRLGYFNGLDVQGFSLARGTMASAGIQSRLLAPGSGGSGQLDAAAQVLQAANVPQNGVAGTEQTTRSVWTAAQWQGLAPWADALGQGGLGLSDRPGGLKLQANLLMSAGQPSNPASSAQQDHARGAWLDADWRTRWLRNSASVFYFAPQLRWGATSVASDIQGLSWRSEIGTRQWQLGWSSELSRSVSNPALVSSFTGLSSSYRLDTRTAISALLGLRTGSGSGQSLQLGLEQQSTRVHTQWRMNASRSATSQSLGLGADQSWHLQEGSSLSTSLGWQRDIALGLPSTLLGWGILGNTRLWGRLNLNASLRGTKGLSGNPAQFLNANIELNWPLSTHWSLAAQYTASAGREPVDTSIVSALTAASASQTLVTQASMHSFMLTLRYQDQNGIATSPIGGRFGSAAGSIEGTVFLDANGNRRRDASEAGVPSATVILNGRFIAKTDAQGHYVFPAVAVGSYTLEVLPDNIPLPWSPLDREPVKVRVDVRSSTVHDFPMQRPDQRDFSKTAAE